MTSRSTKSESAGLLRRKIVRGQTRETAALDEQPCHKCGTLVLSDTRFDKITCACCVQRSLTKSEDRQVDS